jgi:alanine or glycine:cation symporter, AGCS family
VYVYLISLPLASVLSPATVVNIIDTFFAIMAIPTLTGALLMSPEVMRVTRDYFQRMKKQSVTH